ncbi:MAG: 2-C-methyl-D-erythritol 4-phosphate cytidylyltransferase [Alkaliphilus sp.]|nr:2-C-methyl-D-erythritol 4-phosphate cytidylyltransferase [bacterium AH-315-L21]PHS33213.1 MAG: 2-C-methyl-D-erythritol 4-phosphate cytidylyltransferase [Alkaliphilus sp.]
MLHFRKSIAIIVAAGKGTRMGRGINKQFLLLEGKPILAHTIKAFEECESIDEIIIIVTKGEIDYCRGNIIEKFGCTKVTKIVVGGSERVSSVFRGLSEVSSYDSIITVHDGARPLITSSQISECVETAKKLGSAVLAVQVKDTIKIVSPDMEIERTLKRSELWAIQTPQSFHYSVIMKAYETYMERKLENRDNVDRQSYHHPTDDSSLVEQIGIKVHVIKGDYENLKITTPEDIIVASEIFRKRSECIK